jgi:hypothetical protein
MFTEGVDKFAMLVLTLMSSHSRRLSASFPPFIAFASVPSAASLRSWALSCVGSGVAIILSILTSR